MYTFLLVVLLIVALLLMTAILMQAGKGGGLSANFGGTGTDMFIGTRQAGNLLTKSSWWLGGVFLALAFALSIASTRRSTVPSSVIEQGLTPPPATAPAQQQQQAAPAVPLEPAAPPPGQSKTP